MDDGHFSMIKIGKFNIILSRKNRSKKTDFVNNLKPMIMCLKSLVNNSVFLTACLKFLMKSHNY